MGKFVMETWVIMTLVLAVSYFVETELISVSGLLSCTFNAYHD